MTRFACTLVAVTMLTSSGAAEQRGEQGQAREDKAGEVRAREVRSGGRGEPSPRARKPRDYGRGAVQLKDPAEFGKTTDKQVFSGPQPGETLRPLNAIGVHGDLDGEQFDAIELANGKPQVLILMGADGVGVRGLHGLSRFTAQVAKKSKTGLHVAAIFLGDDTAELTTRVKRYSTALGARVDLIGISPDGRDGPGAYGLNRNISQTIIFAQAGKVLHNFVFPQGMLYADPHVLGALAAVVGEDRETVAHWLREVAAPTRNRRAADGGKASARQTAFKERLKALVEAGKLTRAEAGGLYQIAFADVPGDRDKPMQRDRAAAREKQE